MWGMKDTSSAVSASAIRKTLTSVWTMKMWDKRVRKFSPAPPFHRNIPEFTAQPLLLSITVG